MDYDTSVDHMIWSQIRHGDKNRVQYNQINDQMNYEADLVIGHSQGGRFVHDNAERFSPETKLVAMAPVMRGSTNPDITYVRNRGDSLDVHGNQGDSNEIWYDETDRGHSAIDLWKTYQAQGDGMAGDVNIVQEEPTNEVYKWGE